MSARRSVQEHAGARDYGVFDAELAGRSFNAHLIGRLFGWVRPHWRQALLSGVLVLVASVLAIMMPVIVARVVIDGLMQAPGSIQLPDFGMNAATDWIALGGNLPHLLAGCALYVLITTAWAIASHYHRISLAKAVLGALRDLRFDLFSHLETRPATFFDHVAVGRVMTRVTNDIEVLFQLLSGFGVLVGEFVPFLVAFTLMIAIDPELTGILMLAVPVVALATYFFRRGTRTVYRAIRQSISALNQNLHENLTGIQVVQLNRREAPQSGGLHADQPGKSPRRKPGGEDRGVLQRLHRQPRLRRGRHDHLVRRRPCTAANDLARQRRAVYPIRRHAVPADCRGR